MVGTHLDSSRVDVCIVDSLPDKALHKLELVDVITTGKRVDNHVHEVVEGVGIDERTSQLRVIDSNLVLVLTIAPVVNGLNVRVAG